jgi:hypothetical protein
MLSKFPSLNLDEAGLLEGIDVESIQLSVAGERSVDSLYTCCGVSLNLRRSDDEVHHIACE